jgi:hypothetical protein
MYGGLADELESGVHSSFTTSGSILPRIRVS